MARYSRDEINRRYQYLIKNAGGRRNLASLIINPNTGRRTTPDQLSRYINRGKIPTWLTKQLNREYLRVWTSKNLFTYYFDDWWMVVEHEIESFGTTLEAEGVETALEFIYRKLVDMGVKHVLTVKGFEYPVFGWMNSTSKIADLKGDILVYYFVGYRRSPYNVVVGHSVRISDFIWNPDNMRLTRERIPLIYQMIASEVESMLAFEQERSMAAAWYLVGFIPL